jgi:arginine-tRNA-protein transferase
MIFDEFETESITDEDLDKALASGFRHFGTHFYRYQFANYNENIATVLPLRIRLADFSFSHSQKRLLRKNQDLTHTFRPAFIDDEKCDMFHEHKERFQDHIPSSIYSFLSEEPATVPCITKECVVFSENKMIAVSFLDIGKNSTSSVYGMFKLDYSKRSLGTYTMLLEIQYSIDTNKSYYYPGYAYDISSFYDYKKKFEALEYLDWDDLEWKPLK